MSVLNRIQKLRRQLKERGLDGLLVSQNENRFYLSGFNGEGYLLISEYDAVLITDFRYTEQAGKEAPGYRVFQIQGDVATWFPALLAGMNGARIGFEAAQVPLLLYSRFSEVINNAGLIMSLVPVEGMVEALRVIKEPSEVEFIRTAARITDRALDYIRDNLQAGLTEREAAWLIERNLRENGSDGIAFEVIVAGGANGAMAHHHPSEDALIPGQPIVMDFGARYRGYCADLTRTLTIGKPGVEFEKNYQVVLEAQLKALEEIREGMTGGQADAIARDSLQRDGLAEAFGHSLGHGIGLAIHESPRLGPRSAEVLTDGMVFSIEPGVYLPGWGGIRIEDSVVMENGRLRRLTEAPKS